MLTSSSEPPLPPRPPSPWTGSLHETRHSWQLDLVTTLLEASDVLDALAHDLESAHAAGWELAEPMRSGHLRATRPSRRRRTGSDAAAVAAVVAPSLSRWRLRVVDEPPQPGHPAFHADSAPLSTVLAQRDGQLHAKSGPPLAPALLAELTRQLQTVRSSAGTWAVAPARVGPVVDLVADGSALRIHAGRAGALVRTEEVLTFQHAADRAVSLLAAASAYRRSAHVARAMAAAGGRLVIVADGLLHVGYGDL